MHQNPDNGCMFEHSMSKGSIGKYYTFDSANGSQHFSSLDGLIRHANNTREALWIDVQGDHKASHWELLNGISFGTQVPQTVLSAVVNSTEGDIVQMQPISTDYVAGSVSCLRGNSIHEDTKVDGAEAVPGYPTGDDFGGMVPETVTAETLDASEGMVWCAFIATRRLLVTFHHGPFLGLGEMVHNLEGRYAEAASGKFNPGVGLSVLLSFSNGMLLNKPGALLNEVDNIDEISLLIAPGRRDQPDFLRRVANLRQRISAFRTRLFMKEKVLMDLLSPMVCTNFLEMDKYSMGLCKDTLAKISKESNLLDDARDLLNQSNLNFVTGVMMRMSQSSANLDWNLRILAMISTTCLPLNLLCSIFGMNCKVPFQSDEYPTLTAFYCLLGGMVVWILITSVPAIVNAIRGARLKAIVMTSY
ncbi:unnamed protein product [Phytomonas sp. Hart1]|nr:unnamed protein product [Phytomonas sp. Hart1]|eukprot:CCW70918.1 unnamed protein product [Phytomonas sp. isolate Hart1]